jgi:hypothetical protein
MGQLKYNFIGPSKYYPDSVELEEAPIFVLFDKAIDIPQIKGWPRGVPFSTPPEFCRSIFNNTVGRHKEHNQAEMRRAFETMGWSL